MAASVKGMSVEQLALAISMFAVFGTFVDAAKGQAPEVKKWLDRTFMLDGWCRGDSGDLPTTDKACVLREVTGAELEKLGWCYGKNDEAGYQKRWHVCGPDSQRLTAAPAKPPTLTVAAFFGVWGEVSDQCRSQRAQTEGPYFTIRDKRYVPEGGGICRQLSFRLEGQTLAIRGQCSAEEAGYEPTSARYTLVGDTLKSANGQTYRKCAR
jgi:hypothetical protein